MAKMFETMKETTGVDLAEIMRADTYDARVNRNISIQGMPQVAVSAAADAAAPEAAEAEDSAD
jgi:flotillin